MMTPTQYSTLLYLDNEKANSMNKDGIHETSNLLPSFFVSKEFTFLF